MATDMLVTVNEVVRAAVNSTRPRERDTQACGVTYGVTISAAWINGDYEIWHKPGASGWTGSGKEYNPAEYWLVRIEERTTYGDRKRSIVVARVIRAVQPGKRSKAALAALKAEALTLLGLLPEPAERSQNDEAPPAGSESPIDVPSPPSESVRAPYVPGTPIVVRLEDAITGTGTASGYTLIHQKLRLRRNGMIWLQVILQRHTTEAENERRRELLEAAPGNALASDIYAHWESEIDTPLEYVAEIALPAGHVGLLAWPKEGHTPDE